MADKDKFPWPTHEIVIDAWLEYSPPAGQVGIGPEVETKGPLGYRPNAEGKP